METDCPPGDPSRSDIVLESLDDPLEDGLILGNGDLVALAHRDGGRLVFHLTRNGIWDRRLAPGPGNGPMPTGELLDLLAADEARALNPPDPSYQAPYPCPLLCARLVVEAPSAPHRLALASATLHCGPVRAYAHATRDVLVVDGLADEAEVRLEAVAQTEMSPPVRGAEGETQWVRQAVPGDEDVAGCTYRVELRRRPGLALVSVTVDGEAAPAVADGPHAEHASWWTRFWAASGVRLGDRDLERLWYRNLYFLASVNRPGKPAAGLFAGLTAPNPAWHGDYHLNYNLQQQYWGAYPANHAELTEPYDRLILDYLPRARWLAGRLFGVGGAFYPHVVYAGEPSDPESCRAPNGRQYFHHVWGRTLGVTAFAVQNLWWHYVYGGDAGVLAAVYPALRDAARFYAEWHEVTRARDGSDDLYPTVSPEHWGLTRGLKRNRNCAFDLAMVGAILRAASRAAAALGVDAEARGRWDRLRERLPAYPTASAADGPVIVDVQGAPPIEYNVPVPATPVFPAEEIGWWSAPDRRELAARSVRAMATNGNNDLVISALARIRLALPDALDFLRARCARQARPNGTLRMCLANPQFNRFGHYTETFGVSMAVSEVLLQAHDGLLRLFPAWPRAVDAAFRGLRAQGGFEVSAELRGGRLRWAEVRTVAGGPVALVDEWGGLAVSLGSTPVEARRERGPSGLPLLAWQAEPDATYTLR